LVWVGGGWDINEERKRLQARHIECITVNHSFNNYSSYFVHIISVSGEQWGMSRMTKKSVKGDDSHLHTKNDN
jgi:hypothetical protein